MLVAARPYYTTRGKLAESAHVLPAAVAALQSGGTRALALGDADTALAAGHAEQAHYQIGLLPHLALEPLAATARFGKGLLEIWSSSQLPEMARDAAAHATGLSASRVVIHSVMGGGSSGRRFESEVAVQAALLAVRLKRPVQLFWSRGEDTMHDRFGGGYAATLSAQVQPNGSINAWHSAIAGPPAMDQLRRRTLGDASADAAMRAAGGKNWPGLVSAAAPPYAIVNVAIDLHAAATTIPSGPMRGGAALATCFWNESFVNELAAKTGVEPFSFRMALVGDNTRLAQCLAKVTALAGWTGGGRGGNQGLACFATEAMAIAVVAEAKIGENGRVQVSKLTAVADLGQLINPDIARQHIEGGLLFGMQLAVGAPVIVQHGLAGPSRFGDFKLPLLADMPEVTVELLPSNAPAADAWDCAVPVAAPAIAGALFAGSGKRFRTIPFTADQS
jgi:isoquinoline 1-oxidoreductase beta subunit